MNSEMERSESEQKEEAFSCGKKKIFVAGATGTAGKSIVEQLLAKGFAVKAGVRNIDKAKTMFPGNNPDFEIVRCDVTEGSTKLADAIGDDSDAVICATGFQPSWNLLAPWKIDYSGTVKLVEACKTLGLKAERFLRKSGINYTIIRPGGIQYEPPTGNIVMEPEDTLYWGSISRDQVAEVVVEALLHPESNNKVVEIVARADAPSLSFKELFGTKKER